MCNSACLVGEVLEEGRELLCCLIPDIDPVCLKNISVFDLFDLAALCAATP